MSEKQVLIRYIKGGLHPPDPLLFGVPFLAEMWIKKTTLPTIPLAAHQRKKGDDEAEADSLTLIFLSVYSAEAVHLPLV